MCSLDLFPRVSILRLCESARDGKQSDNVRVVIAPISNCVWGPRRAQVVCDDGIATVYFLDSKSSNLQRHPTSDQPILLQRTTNDVRCPITSGIDTNI